MRIFYFDIDCLRPDHLGCYGYNRPTSPTIDRISEGGVRFENYYCSSSPCLPSRTAWASGRFALRNGVLSNLSKGAEFNLKCWPYGGPKPENEMLPRQLRRYDYDTISFSNFADRHNALWFMYGWNEYHTPNLKGGAETAEEVNQPVLHWLKSNAKRENYFVHINYWDVHRCYKMDESWADRFADFPVTQEWPDEKTISEHQSIRGSFTAQGQFKDNKSPYPLMPDTISSRKDFEKLITGYDAAIAYIDHHIKMVLDELDAQGILEDSAIIISGDHGDAFGEHGIYSDHVCADECIHKIPLIIKWPGISVKNQSSNAFLYNTDFAPTLCDLLGMPVPEDWDGLSFAENIKGNEGLDRDYLVWDCGLYTVQRAVRTKTHLMIKTYDNYGYNFEPVELYDMLKDPNQTKNISDENQNLVKDCEKLMHEWEKEVSSKDTVPQDPLQKILEERK